MSKPEGRAKGKAARKDWEADLERGFVPGVRVEEEARRKNGESGRRWWAALIIIIEEEARECEQ